jgi:hypothetical protein
MRYAVLHPGLDQSQEVGEIGEKALSRNILPFLPFLL